MINGMEVKRKTEKSATEISTKKYLSLLSCNFILLNFKVNNGISKIISDASKMLIIIIKYGLVMIGVSPHVSYLIIKGNEVTKIPIAGVGRPRKTSDCLASTLNFASLKAANTGIINGMYLTMLKIITLEIIPDAEYEISKLYKIIPETTPKVTMSARESNCLPKTEYAFNARAISPSIKSNKAARNTMLASIITLL